MADVIEEVGAIKNHVLSSGHPVFSVEDPKRRRYIIGCTECNNIWVWGLQDFHSTQVRGFFSKLLGYRFGREVALFLTMDLNCTSETIAGAQVIYQQYCEETSFFMEPTIVARFSRLLRERGLLEG